KTIKHRSPCVTVNGHLAQKLVKGFGISDRSAIDERNRFTAGPVYGEQHFLGRRERKLELVPFLDRIFYFDCASDIQDKSVRPVRCEQAGVFGSKSKSEGYESHLFGQFQQLNLCLYAEALLLKVLAEKAVYKSDRRPVG